jgi:hypothetical protein
VASGGRRWLRGVTSDLGVCGEWGWPWGFLGSFAIAVQVGLRQLQVASWGHAWGCVGLRVAMMEDLIFMTSVAFNVIIVQRQLVQLLCGLVTKNLKGEFQGHNKSKGRASPVITLFRACYTGTLKELRSPLSLRLLGTALSCA